MPSRDDLIRERAYAIWIEDGRPEGRADEHWQQAAAALDTEEAAVTPITDLGTEPVPLVTPIR